MTSSAAELTTLLDGLCDDAALFPPGNLPLPEAVPAHLAHRRSRHRHLVGPFIVAAAQLPELAPLLDDAPTGSFEVSVTVPSPSQVVAVLDRAGAIEALRVVGLEVVVPDGVAAGSVVPALDAALVGRPEIVVFVELPRDDRRPALVEALSGTPYLAKLRTGGVRADLYPDEHELAAALVATARAGLPFKATAGLHHAVRNTDPETGFEQHGFLNVLAAVAAALSGADEPTVAATLADRDAENVASLVRTLGDRTAAVREQFRSFGTCSIDEPVEELTALGLGPTDAPTGGDL